MKEFTYCTNMNTHGDECTCPIAVDSPVSLCELHLYLAAQYVTSVGGRGSAEVLDPRLGRARPKHNLLQVVYYMRQGGEIKIGTTTDLKARMRAIRHEELMAIEQGGHGKEHARHVQFANLRTDGEWFTTSMDLVAHVMNIRKTYGPPIRAWNRWTAERHAMASTCAVPHVKLLAK